MRIDRPIPFVLAVAARAAVGSIACLLLLGSLWHNARIDLAGLWLVASAWPGGGRRRGLRRTPVAAPAQLAA